MSRTPERVAKDLRGRADLYEESPSGFGMAQVNLPQVLREAAGVIDDAASVIEDLREEVQGLHNYLLNQHRIVVFGRAKPHSVPNVWQSPKYEPE